MDLRASYHTHSTYCDGEAPVEEMVRAAIDAGLDEIGISSHAPLPFAAEWTMEPSQLATYVREVQDLKARYSDRIDVLLGAEIDFIPHEQVAAFQREQVFPLGFDYLIGSVHFLGHDYPPRTLDGTEEEFREILHGDYGGNIEDMIADYYRRVRQMLAMPGVTVVGHLDVIKRWNADRSFFTGTEPWYVRAVEETLEAIKRAGHMVELNTAGWRKGLGEPYPAPWILERCRDLGIPITVNSDAHAPGEVAWGFERARECMDTLEIEPEPLRD